MVLMNMKKTVKILFYLLPVLIAFYSAHSNATNCSTGVLYGCPQDPRDVIDQAGNIAGVNGLEVENTTYFKLCEIRRFFCGGVKTVIIGVAIFAVGLLVIIGKITWARVIIIMSGVAIFSSAEYLTISLTSLPPNLGVIYSCYCLPGSGLFSFDKI
jgi:type IV secretory pathway VirB2 component (pilin)